MSRYYNQDGQPITLMEWVMLFEDTPRRQIALTTLPDGKQVATVWLGLDHNFRNSGPPLIFETLVGSSVTGRSDLDCDRYSTKAEAIAGHQRMVKRWSSGESCTG